MGMHDNTSGFGQSLRTDVRQPWKPDFDPAGFFAVDHQVRTADLAAEQTRLAQQSSAYNDARINNIYDGTARQKQYNDYLNQLKGMYTGQVNDQEDIAGRQLKFAEARNGLTGGSAAADAGGMLSRDYQAGLVNADATAQSGVDALRAADQAQKLALTGVSDTANSTGVGATNGYQVAANSVANNSNAVGAQSLGNFFGDVGSLYQKQQGIAAANKGYYQAGLYTG